MYSHALCNFQIKSILSQYFYFHHSEIIKKEVCCLHTSHINTGIPDNINSAEPIKKQASPARKQNGQEKPVFLCFILLLSVQAVQILHRSYPAAFRLPCRTAPPYPYLQGTAKPSQYPL